MSCILSLQSLKTIRISYTYLKYVMQEKCKKITEIVREGLIANPSFCTDSASQRKCNVVLH